MNAATKTWSMPPSRQAHTSSLVTARYQAAVDRARALGLAELGLEWIDYRGGSNEAVRRWLGAGITGVVAFNDDVAAAVASAAVRSGLQLPADLAVIGHDDAPIATMFVPGLSTIRIDTVALGRRFADFVLHRVEQRPAPIAHTVPGPVLIQREST